jgi:hypothetical protein
MSGVLSVVGETALHNLAHQTLAGHVFGPSAAFGPNIQERTPDLLAQLHTVASIIEADLASAIKAGFPEKTAPEVRRVVGEIVLKASVFCSFLPVGELAGMDNNIHLARAGCAIGAMYASNTLMDRGDEAMLLALEQRYHRAPAIPARLAAPVAARHHLPVYIARKISQFARPEDRKFVLQTYDTVLDYEAQLRRLGNQFLGLGSAQARRHFLAQNARQVSTLMALDAGVPSVAASLYAIYRTNNPKLPGLREIHNNPRMQEALAAFNATARVGDDLGDAEDDTGQNPAWSLPNINLCNDYNPGMIQTICHLAQITDTTQVGVLQKAFAASQTPEGRAQHGESIGECFFRHIRVYTGRVETGLPKYKTYLRLCKRILEISYVNMLHGDRNMIASAPPPPA